MSHFKYPIIMRNRFDGTIVEFQSLTDCKVLLPGRNDYVEGEIVRNTVPHTDTATWDLCEEHPSILELNHSTIQRLIELGVLKTQEDTHRSGNVGASDYAAKVIQPWTIWREYNLDPWEADIIKRVLRTKRGESRRLDFKKIAHICEEIEHQYETGFRKDTK